MALFLSTYTKKIDKKGRVLVPNAFRSVLAAESFAGVVVYGSFINPCIEACGMRRMEALYSRIARLDPYSVEYDAFSSVLMSGSHELTFDGEGRIMLPEALLAQAEIKEDVIFMGKGEAFEVWEPSKFAAHMEAARTLALEKRAVLRAGGGGEGTA